MSRTCGTNHQERLTGLADETRATDLLCELNVIEQVANVCHTTIVRDAWERGQELSIHGWIYGLKDGHLNDLNVTVTNYEETSTAYQAALAALA